MNADNDSWDHTRWNETLERLRCERIERELKRLLREVKELESEWKDFVAGLD